MDKRYILGLDEGTTSVRTIVYDTVTKKIVATSQKPFKQYYPHSGWVEQDANDIWECQKFTITDAIKQAGITSSDIAGMGITNQRETIVAWNKKTGEPIYNAIVWQCRRGSEIINKIPFKMKGSIKVKTGLIPNSYFSASKIKWIFDNVPEAKKLSKVRNLCIGTIDSFLAYKFTGKFVTDTTNASRTMLFNIHSKTWDDKILNYFKIPISCLPKVVDCNETIGKTIFDIPLCAMIGDQQSSLFGQMCLKPGMAKATYGTGCFILMNIGSKPKILHEELCSIAYTIDGKSTYALEGSIYSACSAINWLQENLNLFDDVKKTEDMCNAIKSNEDVYFVPAFTGIGAPYWDDDCRGLITGMTLATNKNHIVRACIESMAYNTCDIINDMSRHEIEVKELHVDGGGSKNKFLLQFQADILQKNVLKSAVTESTAMGAVYMVMLNRKMTTLNELLNNYSVSATYTPKMSKKERDKLYFGWQQAVYTAKYNGQVKKYEE